MIYSETPRRKLVTKLVTWGHWFTFANMLIAIVLSGVYFLGSPMPWTPTGSIYLFINWFGHIGFLIFIGFVIFLLPLCYLLPNPKLIKTLGAVIAASGIALLVFDALLYNRYGLHLSIGSAQLIQAETQTVVEQFGAQHWGFLVVLFTAWLSFQLIVANAIWQRLERLQKRRIGLPITGFFVSCFVLSHAMHIWADARLYQPILIQDDIFPLSYPATAKTLMSRYGLMDRDHYQQRKQLQFGNKVTQVNYPSEPVYCSVGFDKQTLLFVATDKIETLDLARLQKIDKHYSFASTPEAKVLSILYGLPQVYQPALVQHKPLLLDIPARIGLDVSLFWQHESIPKQLTQYQRNWQEIEASLSSDDGRVVVIVAKRNKLMELLPSLDTQKQRVIVTSLVSDDSNRAPFFTNLALEQQLSSQEDIAPTLLNAMGCQANSNSYSTGKNLQDGNRNWVISTDKANVFVLYNGHRIQISSNGNHKIMQQNTLEVTNDELNIGLLSQAMKHLSRFKN